MLNKLKTSVTPDTIKKGLIVVGIAVGALVAGAVAYHYANLETVEPVESEEPPFETE